MKDFPLTLFEFIGALPAMQLVGMTLQFPLIYTKDFYFLREEGKKVEISHILAIPHPQDLARPKQRSKSLRGWQKPQNPSCTTASKICIKMKILCSASNLAAGTWGPLGKNQLRNN